MRALAVLLLAVTCAACGLVGTAPAAPPSAGDVAAAAVDPVALAAWAGFPASARPRPLVIDALPRGLDKTVPTTGRFVLAVPAPAVPPTLPVSLPEGRFALPSATAAQAAAAMSSPGPDLTVTSAALGTGVFATDRAARVLPAWVFTLRGVTGTVTWPALAPSTYRTAPTGIIHGTRVSADDRSLIVTMPTDPPREDCPGAPRVRTVPVALESPGAVDVGLRTVLDGTVPGAPDPACGRSACTGCASPAIGYQAQFTVPLAAPLGGRVVLGPIGGIGQPPVVLGVESP